MTATAAPTVKDQELVSFGLVESASVNSIADFIPSEMKERQATEGKEDEDFANTFICHLIFYSVLCLSLLVHIFVDFGFGSFLKNKFFQLIRFGNKMFFEKSPAFA